MFLKILNVTCSCACAITPHNMQLFPPTRSELVLFFFLETCFNYKNRSFGNDIFLKKKKNSFIYQRERE